MSARFWRPGEASAPSANQVQREQTRSAHEDSNRAQLPLDRLRSQFLGLIENFQTLVLVSDADLHLNGEIALWLRNAGWSQDGRTIAVAIPRRADVLAEVEYCTRCMTSEKDREIADDKIGYSLRFTRQQSSRTEIMFYTFSSLISAIRHNPLLYKTSVVIVDTIRSRSAMADTLAGILRLLQHARQVLRLVFLTTSVDSEDFLSLFDKVQVKALKLPRKACHVDINFLHEPVEDVMMAAADTLKALHEEWISLGHPSKSDILAFVPGPNEVEMLCDELSQWAVTVQTGSPPHKKRNRGQKKTTASRSTTLEPIPLHAALTPSQQMRALSFNTTGLQRIVVATSIAELSLRVPGISTVVDTGYDRLRLFDAKTGSLRHVVVPVPQNAAHYRTAAAGVRGSGRCFRLYTKNDFYEKCPPVRAPEILRTDLCEAILALKSVGIEDFTQFKFPTPPSTDSFAAALSRLHALNAVLPNGRLTDHVGRRLIDIPLPPHFGRALIAGQSRGLARHVAAIFAMLTVSQSLSVTGGDGKSRKNALKLFAVAEGDLITLLNVYRRYQSSGRSTSWCNDHGLSSAALSRADTTYQRLMHCLRKGKADQDTLAQDLELSLANRICRALAQGLFEYLAMVEPDGKHYRLVISNTLATIHPTSVLDGRAPRWIVATEFIKTNDDAFLRHVNVVQPEWLVQDVPSVFSHISTIELNPHSGRSRR